MNNPKWKRPKTQKLYLHGPYAERIVMLWPDFKITNYAFSDNGKHTEQESTGILVIHDLLDQNNTKFFFEDAKIPLFKACNDIGVKISMEAFSLTDRNPNVFSKIELYNDKHCTVCDSIILMARTGNDRNISNTSAEGYCSHKPNPGTWYYLEKNWKSDGFCANDGKSYVTIKPSDNLKVEWIDNGDLSDMFIPDQCYKINFELKANESATIELSQCYGTYVNCFDYETEKKKTKNFWNNFFSKVHTVPDTDNKLYQDAYFSLLRQSMQMMARYIEHDDLVAPRQGDIGCFIWPWESTFYLHFLDKAGLWEYTKDAYKFFVQRYFQEGGEDDGKIMSNHQQWGNLNGTFLWAICGHLMYTKSKEDFEYYRPYLNRALDWIERQRKISFNLPDCKYKGLFSARKASDWNGVAQYWMGTDSVNVNGIRTMAEAYRMFSAEETDYVQKVYEDYFETIRNILNEFYKGHENDEIFLPPHQLGAHEPVHPFLSIGVTKFFENGIIEPNEKMVEQIENWFIKKGFHKRGLKCRMSCASGGDKGIYAETYYTTNGDTSWLDMYLKRGEIEKAKECFDAIITYGMTEEFVVAERYSPYDEWFAPWQPNGSGSGRIGMALLKYFGEKKI